MFYNEIYLENEVCMRYYRDDQEFKINCTSDSSANDSATLLFSSDSDFL